MSFKDRQKTGFIFLLVSSLVIFLLFSGFEIKTEGLKIRPVRDDVGFCWNYETMKKLVDYLESHENGNFQREGLVAGISPHDDYLYAGRIYYPLYKILRTKEVVIFGVTHGIVRNEIKGLDSILILDEFDLWKGGIKTD